MPPGPRPTATVATTRRAVDDRDRTAGFVRDVDPMCPRIDGRGVGPLLVQPHRSDVEMVPSVAIAPDEERAAVLVGQVDAAQRRVDGHVTRAREDVDDGQLPPRRLVEHQRPLPCLLGDNDGPRAWDHGDVVVGLAVREATDQGRRERRQRWRGRVSRHSRARARRPRRTKGEGGAAGHSQEYGCYLVPLGPAEMTRFGRKTIGVAGGVGTIRPFVGARNSRATLFWLVNRAHSEGFLSISAGPNGTL